MPLVNLFSIHHVTILKLHCRYIIFLYNTLLMLILIYQDNISTLTGTLVIPIREKRMAFTLGDEIERLNISFKVINDNLYTGIVNLNDINIERFGFPKAYLNASLIGKGENINAFEFNGELNVQSLSNDKLPFTLSSQISINDKSVELLDLKFTLSDLMVSSPLIGYDTNVGNLLGNFDINYTRRNFDRDYLVTSSLDFDLNIGKYDSVLEFADYTEDFSLYS